VPSHIVCGLGIAGIGTLPYGLRWLVEGEVCGRAFGWVGLGCPAGVL
jgi:hypothetical protein